MCNYYLRFTKKSQKQLRQLKSIPENKREKIHVFLEKLSFDPALETVDSKSVFKIGTNCFSKDISCGDRIVYKVFETTKTVIAMSLFGHYCDNGGRKHM